MQLDTIKFDLRGSAEYPLSRKNRLTVRTISEDQLPQYIRNICNDIAGLISHHVNGYICFIEIPGAGRENADNRNEE